MPSIFSGLSRREQMTSVNHRYVAGVITLGVGGLYGPRRWTNAATREEGSKVRVETGHLFGKRETSGLKFGGKPGTKRDLKKTLKSGGAKREKKGKRGKKGGKK